jgi:CAAX protease family protein
MRFSIVAAMRPLRALILYLVVVFLGGALLAPWLYWLAQAFAPEIPRIANSPFHRYVDRALLGLALLGLWPLLKSLGATSPRDLGLVRPSAQWEKLGGGFLLGFLSLAAVVGLALAAGARHFNAQLPAAQLVEKLSKAALAAMVVAVLEEILFRGALFGSLRRVFHWIFALVSSSMIYAIVHFMERAELHEPIAWYSGLKLLPLMLRGFGDVHAIIPGFFNLTLAGALLALAYQRTGNLYFSIGLHAGWIFWLKSYGILTAAAPGANGWWWGSSKLIDGWLALPVLAAALLIFQQLPLARTQNRRP